MGACEDNSVWYGDTVWLEDVPTTNCLCDLFHFDVMTFPDCSSEHIIEESSFCKSDSVWWQGVLHETTSSRDL